MRGSKRGVERNGALKCATTKRERVAQPEGCATKEQEKSTARNGCATKNVGHYKKGEGDLGGGLCDSLGPRSAGVGERC